MSTPAPDLRLIHHHVGGRGGDTGFNIPAVFEKDVVRVLYDADADATAQAEAQSASTGRTTVIRPYFVGAAGRKVAFTINYCPYTSSVRTIAPRFAEYHLPVEGTDYVIRDVTAPLRTVEIESRSLDDLVRDEAADLPAPDLLSLDTEGGEDDILAGAERLLDERILAVISEVKLNPFYTDGPLFADISATLFRHGFLFVDFDHLGRLAPMRGRLGTRGRGIIIFADAVFLKDPTRIDGGTAAATALALRKLAFVALCRGQLEYAQFCLRQIAEPVALPADAPAYLRFVDQFQRLCSVTPDVMPWTFEEAYSAARSEARFRTMMPEQDLRDVIADTRRRAAREVAKIERSKAELNRAAAAQPMVQLFERYGLADIARLIADTQQAVVSDYVASVVHKADHG